MASRAPSRLDLVGGALLLALAAWTAAVGGAVRGVDVPAIGTVLGSGAAWTAGRVLGVFGRWQVPLAITAGAIAVAAWGLPTLLDPLTGPLGYANATAAFFLAAATAALMVAVAAPHAGLRPVAAALALLFAAVPWLNGNDTAAALTLLLPVALFVGWHPRRLRTLLIAGATLVLLAFAMTAILGARHEPGPRSGVVDRVIDATLDERRVMLWHDAVVLTGEDPLTGVGSGGYRALSPTALAHPTTQRAHSAYLQMAAETGLPGLGLTLAVVLWGFTRLWRSPAGPVTALAAAALTASATQAAVDYIWHFPLVPITVAALLGTGCAVAGARSPQPGRSDVTVS